MRILSFFLFFGLFFNYIFYVGNEFFDRGQLFSRAAVAIFALLIILFFRARYSIVSLATFSLLILWTTASSALGTDPVILNFAYLTVLVFAIGSMRAPVTTLIYSALLATIAVLALHFYLIASGQIPFDPVTIGGRTRFYLGFTNPNKAGFAFFSIAILVYLHFRMCGFTSLVALLASAPFVAPIYFTGSRTALFAFALFVGLQLVPRLKEFRFLIPTLPFLFLLLSALASTQCGTHFDTLLSHRACMYAEFIADRKPADYLYGARFEGYLVDNSYLLGFFSLGLIGYSLATGIIYLHVRSINSNVAIAFIISMLVYGLFEGVLVRPEFPLVVIFYSFLYGTLRANQDSMQSAKDIGLTFHDNLSGRYREARPSFRE